MVCFIHSLEVKATGEKGLVTKLEFKRSKGAETTLKLRQEKTQQPLSSNSRLEAVTELKCG